MHISKVFLTLSCVGLATGVGCGVDSDSDFRPVADSGIIADAASADAVNTPVIDTGDDKTWVRWAFEGEWDPEDGVFRVQLLSPEDGLSVVSSGLQTSEHASYCAQTIVQDGVLGSGPPDTIELRTPDGRLATAAPGEIPVPSLCSPAGANTSLYPILGVFCAEVIVESFFTTPLSGVHAYLTSFGGTLENNGPYTDGQATSIAPPAGFPVDSLGVWSYGDLTATGGARDESSAVWVFKNVSSAPFSFEGEVVAAIEETCGNDVDDDCDGVVDEGCLADGAVCVDDADCLSEACTDGVCGLPLTEDCGTPGDEDLNGVADCADAACSATQYCPQELIRFDFEANDGGFTVNEGAIVIESWEYGVPTTYAPTPSGTRAWVTDLDGPYLNNESSQLTSPTLDVSEAEVDVEVSFQIRHRLAASDVMYFEYSLNDGSSWVRPEVGDFTEGMSPFRGTNDDWSEASITIPGSRGIDTLRVRFVFTANASGVDQGIGIDDVVVTVPSHESGLCLDGVDNDGDGLNGCVDPDCVGTEACLETGAECFDGVDNDLDTLLNCADPDCYAEDECSITLPYAEDFDISDGAWTAGGSNSTWIWQVPTSLGGTRTGSGRAWVTNHDGNHAINERSHLTSPSMDFSGESVDPTMTFQLRHQLNETFSEAMLQTSVDGGGWRTVPSRFFVAGGYNGPNGWTDNNGAWRSSTVILDSTAGSSDVRIRFYFDNFATSVQPGVAIDEVRIESTSTEAGACTGGADDDADLLIDCADPDCADDAACTETAAECSDAADNDGDTLTDCADPDCYAVAGCRPVVPYTEDFEVGDGGWTRNIEGTFAVNSWEWGVPSASFGAGGGSRAWVTNLDGDYVPREVAYLRSPIIDASATAADLRVSFRLRYQTQSSDETSLFYSIDGGASFRRVEQVRFLAGAYPVGTERWQGDSSGWTDVEAVLVDSGGEDDVVVELRFTSNSSNQSAGVGIDEVEIREPPSETGRCRDGIDNDSDGIADCFDSECIGTPECVEEGAECSGGLDDDGDSLTDCSDPDCYEQAFCSLTLPYTEFFDASDGGWTVSGSNATWEWGVPALFGSASGARAWVTNLDGNHNINERSYVTSPVMDFSAESVDPTMTFRLRTDMNETFTEGLLQVSTNNGSTWTTVPSSAFSGYGYNGPNGWTDNSSSWVESVVQLPGTAGSASVRLRFYLDNFATSVRGGMGIDSIVIESTPSEVGSCGNGGDDDGDGLSDCDDPDCASDAVCTETSAECSGGVDEDSDGLTDCADPDCYAVPACVPTIPYEETFELSDGGWTTNDSGTFAITSWEWGTPGASFGAGQGTRAWVTNLDGDYRNREVAHLRSPTIDASGAIANLLLTGRVRHTFASSDQMNVYLSTDGGSTFRLVENVRFRAGGYGSGAATHWRGTSAGWFDIEAELVDTVGESEVVIEFRFTSNSSGVALGGGIDHVRLTVGPNEVGSCRDGVDNDTDGLTDCFDAECAVAPECVEEGAECSDGLDNDGDGTTDCADSTCYSIPGCTPTPPYREDFDASDGGWTSGGSNNTWEWGIPAVLDDAYTGDRVWATNLDGNHNINERSWVQSPVLDFSALAADGVVRLYQRRDMNETFTEALLQVSVGGGSFVTVPSASFSAGSYNIAAGWSGTNGAWTLSSATLPGTAGASNVRIRVYFDNFATSARPGFLLDAVEVLAP